VTEAEWTKAEPFLTEALDRSGEGYPADEIRRRIEAGEAQAWVGKAALLVTVTYDEPAGSVLHLWLAGGDLSELVTVLRPQAEAWGRTQGCNKAIIVGRAGWVRTLAEAGYAERARVVEKALA
jgi:hypothetical protein